MSPSKLGVFAHLALAASAVLIPSTMTAEDLGDDRALETFAMTPSKRSVALECPECAFATVDGNALTWKLNAGNTFRLDFDVGPDENTLNLDNSQIYPPSISLAFQPHYVTQVDPSSEEGVRLRITGLEFELNGAETISDEGTELLPMKLKILSIENMPMNPPSLQINVLKDSQGRLMIASFNKAEPSQAAPSDKDCNEWPLYCKWKSIMADRLERLKHMGKPRPNCHKRPHGHMESEMAGKPPHRMHHGMGHHGMGHGHGRHGHHHRFTMFIRRAFFTIFVPILIGIFAGTLTYLVGMALGCLIAMTVAKFRGQRYQPIALSEDDVEDVEDVEAQEDGEKEEYAELPAYDAPPVYEDAADKTVDETK